MVRCGFPLAGDDLCQQTLDGRVGYRDHLLIGPVLDRMFDVDRSRVGAECSCLDLCAADELCRGNKDSRNATALELNDVVHTARRAAASIGESFDDDVAGRRDLVA